MERVVGEVEAPDRAHALLYARQRFRAPHPWQLSVTSLPSDRLGRADLTGVQAEQARAYLAGRLTFAGMRQDRVANLAKLNASPRARRRPPLQWRRMKGDRWVTETLSDVRGER